MKKDVNYNEVLEVINEVEKDASEYIGHVAEVVCDKIRIGVSGLCINSKKDNVRNCVYLDDVVRTLADCFMGGNYTASEYEVVRRFINRAKAAITELPKVTIEYTEGDK